MGTSSRAPYMDTIARPLQLIGLVAAALAVLTAAAVLVLRAGRVRRPLRKIAGRRPLRWLPGLAAVLCARRWPASLSARTCRSCAGIPAPATAAFVAGLQRLHHLPVDPARLYAEDTLYWVIWYVGAPPCCSAGSGWRCSRGAPGGRC